jgi:hypothetical protein
MLLSAFRSGNPLEQIVALSDNCSQNLLRACQAAMVSIMTIIDGESELAPS